MKKFLQTCLLMLFVLVSSALSAQVLQEGFEGTTFPPSEWTTIHVSGTINWERNTSYAHTGSASAKANWASAGHENYLITPLLTPAAGEELHFWIRTNNWYENTTLTVEISTTGNAASDFTTTLASYTSNTEIPTTYAEKIIDLSAYVGQNIYVAFHVVDDNGLALYLDDVSGVSLFVPSCPNPTNVTVSNITTTTADVAWTAGGTETEWTIDCNGTEVVANSNPFTLTGLNPATAYTVKVRANCAADDLSTWSQAANFATNCETFYVTETTPYQESFDATDFPPICWVRNHTLGTATSQWVRTTGTTSIPVHTAPGAAQLEDQKSENRNDLVTGVLNIPEANAYQVSFWMYRSNYSTIKPNEGVKVWVNITPDTVGATEIAYIHREYTLAPTETAIGWYKYEAVIPNSGDMFVIFQGISEWGQASYIDDISVEKAPSCLKPTNVTASNITNSTADVAWTAGGTETEWTINYNGTEIVANANPFTLTGLMGNTNYTVKVRANCSETETSDWSAIVTFRTNCDDVTITEEQPYTEDFTNYQGNTSTSTAGMMPDCWDYIYTGTNNNYAPHVYSGTHVPNGDNNNGLIFVAANSDSYGRNTYAIMPSFTNDLSGMILSFKAKQENTSYGDLSIGYIENEDTNSYQIIATLPRTTVGTNRTYTLPAIPQGARLAFRWNQVQNTTWYTAGIDDITLRMLSSKKDIVTFSLQDQTAPAVIDNDNHTVSVEVSFSARIDSLRPVFTISPYATVTPASGVSQDFTNPVTYTVTAEDSTTQAWVVTVSTLATASTENNIVSFTFNSQVGEAIIDTVAHTVNASIEWDAANLNIRPTIGISPLATISPISGIQRDFTSPLAYTVTAEDTNYRQDWIVSIIRDTNACPNPLASSVTINVTTDSAFATWSRRYLETAYNVKIATTNINPATATGDIFDATITDTLLKIANLQPNTLYYAFLQSDCGTEEWISTTFRTECAPMTITATTPYTEDFASYTATNYNVAGVMPNCWDRISTGTSSSNAPHVYAGTYCPNGSTNKALVLTSGSAAYGANNYAILPEFTNDYNGMMLSFKTKMESPISGTLTVGYVVNMDATTFQAVATIPSSTSPALHTIDLTPAPANARIAFKWSYSSLYYCVAIDDVELHAAPTCLKPTAVIVSNITETTADVAWTAGSTETEWAINYNGTEEVVTTNPYTLTGLTAETNYTVKVRAICSETDTSEWSAAQTFYTGICVPAPTSIDGNGITNVTFGTDIIVNNTTHPTTAPVYGDYTAQVGSAAAGTDVNVNITYETGFDYGTVIWVNWNNDITFDPTEVVFYANSSDDDITTLAARFTIPATTPVGTYRMRIGGSDSEFDDINDLDPCLSTSYTIYEDYTLQVTEAPACLKPTNVTVSNVTTTTADIAWTANGTETEWVLNYNGTEEVVTTNPYTLTGLTVATEYTVKVRAICSETDSSDWSNTVNFMTECEVVATFPYTQDFTETMFPPLCWFQERTAVGTGTYGADYPDGAWTRFTNTQGTNNTPMAKLRDSRAGSKHNLVTGAFNFTNAAGYVLSVDVYRNATGTSSTTEGIRIYASNTPAIDANSEELAFISRNYTTPSTVNAAIVGAETATGWYTYELPIVNTTGLAYIIFEGNSQYGSATYMDNIILMEMPTCFKPTNVTVSNVTGTTAEVAWTASGDETEWIINLDGTLITANTNPFTLTGLTERTSYTLSVAANCGGGDTSVYTLPVSFRTGCEGTFTVTRQNPFSEDFTAYESTTLPTTMSSQPDCWDFIYTGTDNNYAPHVYNGTYAPNPSDNSLVMTASTATSYSVLPVLTNNLNTLEISFKTKMESAEYGTLTLGYITDANQEASFVALEQIPSSGTTAEHVFAFAEQTFPANARFVFRWSHTGSINWFVAIDDILVTLGCETPTNVQIDENHTVTWDGGEAASWELQYSIGTDTTVVPAANPIYTLTNLPDSVDVTVSVRAICDATHTSPWSDGVTFNTTPTDTTPTDTTGLAAYAPVTAKVFPNPTREVINVHLSMNPSQIASSAVQIFDIYGRMLLTMPVEKSYFTIDMTHFATGVYVLRVVNATTILTNVKVVKE